jgi:hypothetical protein
MTNPTQGGLSEPRRRLVRLMQRLLFGRIENLLIRRGQPVLDPPPTVIREHKFGGENGPHTKHRTDDFLLKDQVVELFRQLDALGDGVIAVLEIKHGLPFRMLVAEPPGDRAD